jgi:ABC-type multidrug transport system fused ATPase/permease subunit
VSNSPALVQTKTNCCRVKLDENLDARRAARFWTQDNCVYIYTALMVLTLVLSIVATTSFTAYFTRTAEKLHELMFTAVVKGTLQFFFTNPSGCVLNRLSKDMGAADTNVPKYLLDTLQVTFLAATFQMMSRCFSAD